MEKLNFVRNGVIRLPPGFRFHPTDEELVVQYLRRKVFAYPLPASIIPEVDICKYDPWDLPGDSEQERYFFSIREAKYRNGSRPNRATGSGYWKATGIDKRIVTSKSNQAVGMKKTLVFYRGKPPHGCRTDWIMHEYRLAEAGAILPQQRKNSAQASMEDWVLCRIFLKKRNTRSEEDVVMQQPCKKNQVANLTLPRPRFIDFMMQDKIVSNQYTSTSSSSSSSSGSSGITEVSSSVSDQEENGSSSSNVSSFS